MRVNAALTVVFLALGAALASASEAPPAASTPEVFNSACALAESMAGKLGSKIADPERVKQTCDMLAPSKMGDDDRKEFMRCCTRKLSGGDAPAPKGGGTEDLQGT